MKKGSQGKGNDESHSRRERQVMDIVYGAGRISAREIMEQMDDPPTYATVRTILGVLVKKGHLKRELEGRSYMYRPTRSRRSVARNALNRVLETFYGDSVEHAVYGLLELRDGDLDPDELERIERFIDDYKRNKNDQ